MRLDKLTEKSREALLEAQHLAEENNNPAVEPEHLLAALLQQEGGVVPSVINKIGGDPRLLAQSVEVALAKMPRATGTSVQVGMSRDLTNILNEAESIAEAMKDDFTSTEHLLMARGESAAVRQLGNRLNGEVRGNCPVGSQQYAEHSDHARVLQLREAEDDQP